MTTLTVTPLIIIAGIGVVVWLLSVAAAIAARHMDGRPP